MKTFGLRERRHAPVVVVGAGMAGLCAALRCAALGLPVVIFEQAGQPGGKVTQQGHGPRAIDVGPTVMTMRWVFEELFDACGLVFANYVTTLPMAVLARHFWSDGAQLDLHQELQANEAAIGAFAGLAAARGYAAFCSYTREVYEAVRDPFIRAPKPSWRNLRQGRTKADIAALMRIDAHVSMHRRLQRFFSDPRLLQLFGRYATYSGGSPYQTPATLNLIAHIERQGVWRVQGGMGALVRGIAEAAKSLGVRLHCNQAVASVIRHKSTAVGVRLADGTEVDAAAVIVNAGPAAVASLLGQSPRSGLLGAGRKPAALSAVTCAWTARVTGAPLIHHNVFFSDNYAAEFADIFKARRLPRAPTVYVCASDRHDTADGVGGADERIFALLNAPTGGKDKAPCSEEIRACLAARGLTLTPNTVASVCGPEDFARRFAHTDGALYGDAPHSWRAFFKRAGSRSTVSGLYMCGGLLHPGPGLPLTALSGQQAALALAEDFGLTSRLLRAATAGGTSMPKATTAPERYAP